MCHVTLDPTSARASAYAPPRLPLTPALPVESTESSGGPVGGGEKRRLSNRVDRHNETQSVAKAVVVDAANSEGGGVLRI